MILRICIPASISNKGYLDMKCPISDCKMDYKNLDEKECDSIELIKFENNAVNGNNTFKLFSR